MTEQTTIIRLSEGEHALFGYGSLLSPESLERTLGRRYTGPFAVTGLRGWRRTWDIAMPDTRFHFQDTDGAWVVPERILYLNVQPDDSCSINGVIFVVNENELADYDRREWIYDRVAVNDRLEDVRIEGGSAWVYVAKPEFLLAPPESPHKGAVRQTYLNFLADGHSRLGEEFRQRYYESTDPVPQHLVVDDRPRE